MSLVNGSELNGFDGSSLQILSLETRASQKTNPSVLPRTVSQDCSATLGSIKMDPLSIVSPDQSSRTLLRWLVWFFHPSALTKSYRVRGY